MVWIRPELWAKWSPDGRWIALPASVSRQGFWYLVAADGSGTRRIEEFANGLLRVDFLDWSPDGRSLASIGDLIGCVDGVCLGIVPSEGEPVSLVEHPSGRDPNMHGKLFWPEFSPDGDRLAIIGNLLDFTSDPQVPETNTLYSYDLATAGFTELTSWTGSLIFDATGAAQSTGPVTGELVEGARSPGRRTVESCCTSFVRRRPCHQVDAPIDRCSRRKRVVRSHPGRAGVRHRSAKTVRACSGRVAESVGTHDNRSPRNVDPAR